MSTFNELIDFTRSTTGTYLDSVVYGEELVTNGTFDSGTTGWFTSPSGGVTGSVVNGEYNLNNTAGGGKGVTQVFKTQAGKTYKITATARKISGISAFLVAAQTNWGFSDNLAYASTTSSSNVELSVTFKAVDEESYVYLRSDAVGVTVFDNVSVKEIIGGQVSGTPLLRTAAINEPRLEYDASGNPLGLLIEEARTNFIGSSLFDTAYTNQSVTRVLNQSGAPDGTSTATKVLETGGTAFHRTFTLMTFISGNIYTQSVYAKSIGGRVLQLTVGGQSFGAIHVNFDLENGVVGSSVGYTSASITDAGNGWYRCVATATATQTNSTDSSIVSVTSPTSGRLESFTGDTSKGLLVFGHQVEAGAFPTSYIPTSGSAVTRAADIASLPVERFGYNQAQGSVVVSGHYSGLGSLGSSGVFELNTASNGVELRLAQASGEIQGYDNNGIFVSNAGNVPVNSDFKIALGFVVGGTNAAASYNGSITNAYASVDVNTVSSIELFKHDVNLGRILNGHLKSVQYYPLRLSNARLQALTS